MHGLDGEGTKRPAEDAEGNRADEVNIEEKVIATKKDQSADNKNILVTEKKTIFTRKEVVSEGSSRIPFQKLHNESAEKETDVPASEGAGKTIVDEIDMNEVKRIQDQYESNNTKGDILFRARCKLFRKNMETKKFEDRGEGDMFIARCCESSLYKVSMVRDQIKTLGCNHFIDPRFDCVSVRSYTRAWSWFASSDDCHTGKNDSKCQFYVVRFADDKESANFKKIYDEGRNENGRILASK
uniref:RAN-specific GTPase activating protein-like protein n=1 Tax=Antonospora locustae TaxID=278021 RepID=Q6E6F0_ANTLO|nr:RAN-specific GTPase activating protein-like protein [Antonospora locustae]